MHHKVGLNNGARVTQLNAVKLSLRETGETFLLGKVQMVVRSGGNSRVATQL